MLWNHIRFAALLGSLSLSGVGSLQAADHVDVIHRGSRVNLTSHTLGLISNTTVPARALRKASAHRKTISTRKISPTVVFVVLVHVVPNVVFVGRAPNSQPPRSSIFEGALSSRFS